MSLWSVPKPNRPTPGATIDLFWAGVAFDGTRIYAPPLQALGSQVGYGIGWLIANYPHETLHGLALGSISRARCDEARISTGTKVFTPTVQAKILTGPIVTVWPCHCALRLPHQEHRNRSPMPSLLLRQSPRASAGGDAAQTGSERCPSNG